MLQVAKTCHKRVCAAGLEQVNLARHALRRYPRGRREPQGGNPKLRARFHFECELQGAEGVDVKGTLQQLYAGACLPVVYSGGIECEALAVLFNSERFVAIVGTYARIVCLKIMPFVHVLPVALCTCMFSLQAAEFLMSDTNMMNGSLSDSYKEAPNRPQGKRVGTAFWTRKGWVTWQERRPALIDTLSRQFFNTTFL